MTSNLEKLEFFTKNMDPDFLYILAELDVPVEWQHKLVESGYRKTVQFAAIEDTKAEVRKASRYFCSRYFCSLRSPPLRRYSLACALLLEY